MLNSQIQFATEDPAGGPQLGQGVHYDQLINVPRLATEAQGEMADTAIQPADPVSDLTNDLGYQTASQVAAGFVPLSRTVNGHSLTTDITVTKADVGLGAVENTALSTWAGSTNIVTIGPIATGLQTGTPGGSGAGTWKLGTRITGVFTLDGTKAVELNIGGTLIKLAVLS